jgi:hypothetical protein
MFALPGGCLLFLQRVANFSILLAGPGILFQVSAVQNQGEIQRRQSERQFITLSLDTDSSAWQQCTRIPSTSVTRPGEYLSPNICLWPSRLNEQTWWKGRQKSVPTAGNTSVCDQLCFCMLYFVLCLCMCMCVCFWVCELEMFFKCKGFIII